MEEHFQHHRFSSHTVSNQMRITHGELTAYDASKHRGKFALVMEPNDADPSGEPIETPFIEIGTVGVGAGYGAQFPPPIGAQALIIFIGPTLPVAAIFFATTAEAPPFPDGQHWGWKDSGGVSVSSNGEGVGLGAPFETLDPSRTVVTIADLNGQTTAFNGSIDYLRTQTNAAIHTLGVNLIAAMQSAMVDRSGDIPSYYTPPSIIEPDPVAEATGTSISRSK